MPYIYCSGPLFCPEEIAGMSAIARVLEQAGYGTFVPHRDGLERFVMGLVNTPLNSNFARMRDRIDRAIFALDVYQVVERCDGFVFNMNGRVPDEGGVAEAAIAFAVGKPVVIFKNDRRSIFKGADNSMLSGLSAIRPVRDLRKLPEAIEAAQDRIGADQASRSTGLASNIDATVRYGKKIWRLLAPLAENQSNKQEIDALVDSILQHNDASAT